MSETQHNRTSNSLERTNQCKMPKNIQCFISIDCYPSCIRCKIQIFSINLNFVIFKFAERRRSTQWWHLLPKKFQHQNGNSYLSAGSNLFRQIVPSNILMSTRIVCQSLCIPVDVGCRLSIIIKNVKKIAVTIDDTSKSGKKWLHEKRFGKNAGMNETKPSGHHTSSFLHLISWEMLRWNR